MQMNNNKKKFVNLWGMLSSSHISPTINDIPALVRLINSDYRSEVSKKGWTTEAYLLDGSLRIDVAALRNILQKPSAIMLKYYNEAKAIIGCVYLQQQDTHLYLGMLTVSFELIAWYEPHGYKKIGKTKPFPDDPPFDLPKQPLEFIVLEKIL